MRILLCDDDPVCRTVVSAILTQIEGHEVTSVNDGDLMLSELEGKGKYDLVVTDIHMPNLNGCSAVNIARSVMGVAIPIIAVTGMALASPTMKRVAGTFTAVLQKPFDVHELTALINKLTGIV